MATIALDPGLRRDVRVIGLVTSAHFFSHFFQLTLPPLFLILADRFQVGFLELGLLLTILSTTTGVVQTPMGFVIDRFGARLPLIVGLATFSVVVMLYGVAPSYWWMLLLAVIGGVANSVFHPADYAILSASVDQSRLGRAFSIHGVTGNIGWALAPGVMLLLATTFNVETAFFVVGALGLATAVLLLLQSGHLHDETETRRKEASTTRQETETTGDGIRLLLSKAALLLFFFQFVFAMAFGGVRNFSIVALPKMFGTPAEIVAGALTGYLIGASFGNLLGGWLADKTGRPQVIFSVNVLIVTGLVALIGTVSMPALLLTAVLVLAGTMQGSLLPARDLLVRAIAPPGQMGKLFGFTSSGLALGNAVTPVLFGWVMDNSDPRWVFYGSAIFMLLALATYVETARNAR